ncbi:MAG: hypothetical protein MUF54_23675 [Polyangiaceae bacterium]|jgi:hypothetical protein|nr:hypothetical protein [Polyangiaceae bacterium]
MGRRKKSELIIDKQGRAWDPDDFFMDSHGVEAPLRERFEKLHEDGFTPEQVSIDIQQRYAKYLKRMAKKGKP